MNRDVRKSTQDARPGVGEIDHLIPGVLTPVIELPGRRIEGRTGVQINLPHALGSVIHPPSLPLGHLYPREHRRHYEKREASAVGQKRPDRVDDGP